MRFVILFDMFLNPGFKMIACFVNKARTAASISKSIQQRRLQIFRNGVFI